MKTSPIQSPEQLEPKNAVTYSADTSEVVAAAEQNSMSPKLVSLSERTLSLVLKTVIERHGTASEAEEVQPNLALEMMISQMEMMASLTIQSSALMAKKLSAADPCMPVSEAALSASQMAQLRLVSGHMCRELEQTTDRYLTNSTVETCVMLVVRQIWMKLAEISDGAALQPVAEAHV